MKETIDLSNSLWLVTDYQFQNAFAGKGSNLGFSAEIYFFLENQKNKD